MPNANCIQLLPLPRCMFIAAWLKRVALRQTRLPARVSDARKVRWRQPSTTCTAKALCTEMLGMIGRFGQVFSSSLLLQAAEVFATQRLTPCITASPSCQKVLAQSLRNMLLFIHGQPDSALSSDLVSTSMRAAASQSRRLESKAP